MKKINFVFVLVIAFALFVCVSGVVSATTYYVPDEEFIDANGKTYNNWIPAD